MNDFFFYLIEFRFFPLHTFIHFFRGFGAVFSAKIQITPNGKKERVAIKKLPHKDKFDRIANYSEMFFSSHLDHPNIVKFKIAYLIPAGSSILKDSSVPEVWMAMEFLQGGTLNEASKIIKLAEKHVAFVAREVTKALKYIHEQGFAHRYVFHFVWSKENDRKN